jgi:hypothetical protein
MKKRQFWFTIWGGGTFDVTVVRYTPTQFRVLATDGDVMLGGLDWSRRIVDHVSEQFKRKFGVDPRDSAETLLGLSQECEQGETSLEQGGTSADQRVLRREVADGRTDPNGFRADDERLDSADERHDGNW